MRTAETILNIIQDRGIRKLPLEDVYRQLYNPDMYLRAYARLYKNDGAMTPGTTGETVDGMSLDKIDRVIEAIRFERWTWPPSRRVYIDKPKGGKRPLGMPDWSPKVVQDVIRSIPGSLLRTTILATQPRIQTKKGMPHGPYRCP